MTYTPTPLASEEDDPRHALGNARFVAAKYHEHPFFKEQIARHSLTVETTAYGHVELLLSMDQVLQVAIEQGEPGSFHLYSREDSPMVAQFTLLEKDDAGDAPRASVVVCYTPQMYYVFFVTPPTDMDPTGILSSSPTPGTPPVGFPIELEMEAARNIVNWLTRQEVPFLLPPPSATPAP